MTFFSVSRTRSWLSDRGLTISPITLCVIVVAAILTFYNRTFIQVGTKVFEGHVSLFWMLVLALFFAGVAVSLLFSSRYTVRIFLSLMLLISAATSYYADQLGVVFDRSMIQNIMSTTFTEGKHLVTPSYVQHMLIFGILPVIAIILVPLRSEPFMSGLRKRSLIVLGCLVAAGALIGSDFKTYASVFRGQRQLMASFQPGAPINSTVRYVKMITKPKLKDAAPLGLDAKKGHRLSAASKPILTILVVGETARAQNFSLNGYEKETNPELSKRDIVNYTNVSSCGTATAVSLPCMFSKYPRAEYDHVKALETENLLDVLRHAGLQVSWWENNTGDKAIAKNVDLVNFKGETDPRFCGAEEECIDGIFLEQLKTKIASITEDTVLVFHQIGSHGPTYYLRYPPEFEQFKPACQTAEFKDCTRDEVANSYDNTILYTDHVLATTIDFLEQTDSVIPALIYVSDHGESLGENGLYLHGAPYFMAPENQTRVPMVVWLSKAYESNFGLEQTCLKSHSGEEVSHDNFFHSVLGLLDIETEVHDPSLDLFAPCLSTPHASLSRQGPMMTTVTSEDYSVLPIY